MGNFYDQPCRCRRLKAWCLQPRNSSSLGIGDMDRIMRSWRELSSVSDLEAIKLWVTAVAVCAEFTLINDIAFFNSTAWCSHGQKETQTRKKTSQLVSLSRDSKRSQTSQPTMIDKSLVHRSLTMIGWWKKSLSSSFGLRQFNGRQCKKENHGQNQYLLDRCSVSVQPKSQIPLLAHQRVEWGWGRTVAKQGRHSNSLDRQILNHTQKMRKEIPKSHCKIWNCSQKWEKKSWKGIVWQWWLTMIKMTTILFETRCWVDLSLVGTETQTC